MAIGEIIQVIGPSVDVVFPENEVPKLLNAIKVGNLTLEVTQIIGNNTVRCIALASTDGLSRGMKAEDFGSAITVPVGDQVLGRMFNVLGETIDNAVIHGNKFSPDKFIEVEYLSEPGKITFMVADQGNGFDYPRHLAIPLDEFQAPKLISKTIKYGTPGGLGMALLRKCADEITFTPPGNKLTFVKHL